MKPKETAFRLPYTVWEQFTKAFPNPGEKSRFLRKAVGVGIRFKERERIVVRELLKVMVEEEAEDDNL